MTRTSDAKSAAVLLLALLGGSAPASAEAPRVLFIGNSFVYVNDLPGGLVKIARSLGGDLVVDSDSTGGSTLERHARDEGTRRKLAAGGWDFVVLQEQSQRPSFPSEQVAREVVPFALELNGLVRAGDKKTRTVFYETWGRKDGDASNCAQVPEVCTYAGMQDRLSATYADLARRTSAVLAPVGTAWRKVRLAHPEIPLYDGDGIHPSPQGTYLAACVFYAVFFRKSSLGADALGLRPVHARILQKAAAETVLGAASSPNPPKREDP